MAALNPVGELEFQKLGTAAGGADGAVGTNDPEGGGICPERCKPAEDSVSRETVHRVGEGNKLILLLLSRLSYEASIFTSTWIVYSTANKMLISEFAVLRKC